MPRLLLDGNSLLNAALLGGIDQDDGRKVTTESGKTVQVNSANYGVDKFFEKIDELCNEFEVAPRDMVLVWDGKNAKLRRIALIENYKGGREKAQEVSDELNLARGIVTQMMMDLGAHVVDQIGLEADDVLGYLCKTVRGERNIVVTADGDLNVLVDENTDVWRLGKLSENPYGPFPHKHITLYKALVGDTSDKIPGAKGFGDGAWCDLVRVFGVENLPEFERMIVAKELDQLAESIPDLKSLQKVIDNKDMVNTSWHAARLHTEAVNTSSNPFNLRAGMVVPWGQAGFQASELKRFYGTQTLVTAANYQAVYERLSRTRFAGSPFVALDIESSSSDESDEWMEALKKATESDRDRIDVLGHELCGMSLTFGQNTQHTIYMSVDHKDTDNITVDQCRAMVELIPQELMIIVQNRSFEFSVLYRTWGDKWMENGWHGFLPNCIDTKVGASYVNENEKKGLKQRSLLHLGYTQTSYEQTTTKSGPLGTVSGGQLKKEYAKTLVEAVYEQVPVEHFNEDTGDTETSYVNGDLISPATTEKWEDRSFKMNELTGAEVSAYGCDDTICTAALQTHYKFVMDIEQTWDTFLAVETLPEYLTSLAFVQGIPINLPELKSMERADDVTYEAAWAVVRTYLMSKGWEGTECPEFGGELEPSDVKIAVEILLGEGFTSKKRKLAGLAFDIQEKFPDNGITDLLAEIVKQGDLKALNGLIKEHFTGEPQINFGSPKQMQKLFYTTLGMTPRIVNKMTDTQRNGDEVMKSAFKKRAQAKRDKVDLFSLPLIPEPIPGVKVDKDTKPDFGLTQKELDSLISKASTDDSAVTSALAMDKLGDREREVLKAFSAVREVTTRRNLFYKTYRNIPHWRDGRIHPSLNQSEAVTRRYSSSGPNVQQLPSKGDGARFRKALRAHHKDAVVVSLDFSGQELRLGAELSGDEAMTSCYVGENLRDMHSLTAVAAAAQMWGEEVAYDDFQKMRKSKDEAVAKKAAKLRGDAKTVNFASQYGAMAAKIAETMMCDEETAQSFLDARSEAFPGIVAWDKRVQEQAHECGYASTMLGARRHLAEALNSHNQWDRQKAERQVGNFWIQSSAAEMTKLAMARVWSSGICTGKYDSVFYCPIHDELVFSVHKDQAYDLIVEAHACMVANYAGMKIPLESSIAIGPDFSCDFEVGTVPDREAIEKVLNEIFHKNTTKELA